eukprot:COSAG06_NODE_14279_length_1171_cov_10.311567_1_plen_53_part_01
MQYPARSVAGTTVWTSRPRGHAAGLVRRGGGGQPWPPPPLVGARGGLGQAYRR